MNYPKLTIYILLFISCFAGIISADTAMAANSSIFTLEAWVRPTTSIATKSVVAKAEEMRMVTDASGNPTCQIKSSSAWQTAEVSSLAISVDTWFHIACSYDKVSLKVFVNGVEKGSTALTVAVDDTVADLKLGTDDSSDDVYGEFEGKIDDVRFYNYARTQKQIVQDMAGGPRHSTGSNSTVLNLKFDEGYGDTANDSSSHNNDGDLAGDCPGDGTCPSWTNSGKFGKALSFDGGDYVDCGAGSSLDITDAITISAWVKPTFTGSHMEIVDKRESYIFGFNYYNSQNILRFIYGDGVGWQYARSPNAYPENEWIHVVATQIANGANTAVKLYKNGVLDHSETLTGRPQSNSVNTLIGVESDGSKGEYFNGSIDSVKIYNYALTPAQIRMSYNSAAINFK